jgi:hypothetical protein
MTVKGYAWARSGLAVHRMHKTRFRVLRCTVMHWYVIGTPDHAPHTVSARSICQWEEAWYYLAKETNKNACLTLQRRGIKHN